MPEKNLEIPEGIEVKFDNGKAIVKGPNGTLERKFSDKKIKIAVKENTITLSTDHDRRKTRALLGTWKAHLNNMITGVVKGYEAKLKIVYSHFPMKFNVSGDKIQIDNFLGERKSRITKIIPGSEVKNDKDIVIVNGIDKEIVGQTAANIENITKVRGFDRRVFQDGIYIIEKVHPVED